MKSKKTQEISFNCDIDGSIMVTSALRYALGRVTYVPSSIQSWITKYWDCLDNATHFIIIRDIIKHLLNMYHDKTRILDKSMRKDWEKFLKNRYDSMSIEGKKEVDNYIDSLISARSIIGKIL